MSDDQKADSMLDPFDAQVFREVQLRLAELPAAVAPPLGRAAPVQVDLGKHLRYIRCQWPGGSGGSGCFAFATLAVWDIMNEMACPYTPNLAIAPWMFLHRRRDAWEDHPKLPGIVTRDGRFVPMKTGPEYGFFQIVGNPTEGTEMPGYSVMPWCGQLNVCDGGAVFKGRPSIGWSVEGMNEAHNYRLDGLPSKVQPISSEALVAQLAAGYPVRVSTGAHVLALVGYDLSEKTFIFVDSYGDKRHNNGFGTYRFAEVDDPQKPLFKEALVFKIRKPLPVPAARVSFTHSNRMNVSLWLSVESSPMPRRQIWPPPQYHDDGAASRAEGRWFPWDDNSRNLSFTVRAPSELMWPPGPGNRLVLDLYDSAVVTGTGGHLLEFVAAFGGHVLPCSALGGGPVAFGANTHHRFFVG